MLKNKKKVVQKWTQESAHKIAYFKLEKNTPTFALRIQRFDYWAVA